MKLTRRRVIGLWALLVVGLFGYAIYAATRDNQAELAALRIKPGMTGPQVGRALGFRGTNSVGMSGWLYFDFPDGQVWVLFDDNGLSVSAKVERQSVVSEWIDHLRSKLGI
ncbi:MAG: hypothetical protein ACJ8C4_06440 [Gemmataceae bacterium]